MSEPTGPVRRRRIAGESPAAAPAKKTVAKKPVAKKAPAQKAPAKKTPVKKAPVTKSPAGTTSAPAVDPTVKKAVPTARRTTARPVRPVAPVSVPEASDARPGAGPTRNDLMWLLPAAIITAALLVLGALLVVRGVDDLRADGAALETSQTQATSAAATAAETIFTYRYDQLDSFVDDRLPLMTEKFGASFAENAPVIEEVAPQVTVQMTGVTQDAAPISCGESCSTDRAEVLLFFDQVRLIGDAKETTTFPRRLKMSMVRTDDGWLVDDIVYLENSPSSSDESAPDDEKAN